MRCCSPGVLGLGCALLLFVATKSAAAQEELSTCLLQDNAPYSERDKEEGFDYDLAKYLASQVGRTFRPEWIPNHTRILEIDDSDFPLFRLKKGKCDAIFSVAGPSNKTLKGHDTLSLGKPYYSAGFELVECPPTGRFKTLSELGGVPVAIQSQSVAHFELLRAGGVSVTTFSLNEALQKSVEVGVGLLWGPAVGSNLTSPKVRSPDPAKNQGYVKLSGTDSCQLRTDFQLPSRLLWNFHVATRKGDSQLRDDLDKALILAAENGKLEALLEKYGIPDRRPFK